MKEFTAELCFELRQEWKQLEAERHLAGVEL